MFQPHPQRPNAILYLYKDNFYSYVELETILKNENLFEKVHPEINGVSFYTPKELLIRILVNSDLIFYLSHGASSALIRIWELDEHFKSKTSHQKDNELLKIIKLDSFRREIYLANLNK